MRIRAARGLGTVSGLGTYDVEVGNVRLARGLGGRHAGAEWATRGAKWATRGAKCGLAGAGLRTRRG
ncbi:hypothetical protein Lesp02_06470 [Lentzea sp. NBRC 105346]|nr:hypothetical protein Lesp02_06470 [Lentzea sp. NBRC 105346]